VHPTESGQRKVVEMLMRSLKTDSTSRPWFVSGAVEPPPDGGVIAIEDAGGSVEPVDSGVPATTSDGGSGADAGSRPATPAPASTGGDCGCHAAGARHGGIGAASLGLLACAWIAAGIRRRRRART